MGKYNDALVKLTESLMIRETIFSVDHPDCLSSLSNMGSLYLKMGKYEKALETYKKCQRIQ